MILKSYLYKKELLSSTDCIYINVTLNYIILKHIKYSFLRK